MGEARWRKLNDPTYGKIPKAAAKRGIIISPPVEVDVKNNRVTVVSSRLDPYELRYALLFWDQLVWPTNRIVHIPEDHDGSFLMSEGILRRPDFTPQAFSGEVADLYANAQLGAFWALEDQEPGCWALAQGANAFNLVSGHEATESRGTLVTLHRAVPVPEGDVPLAEILEFKNRRMPELYRFRSEIEGLYTMVANASDQSLALRSAIDRIDAACSDLIKVHRESTFKSLVASMDFSVNAGQLVTAGGAIIGAMAGEPWSLAAVGKAIGGAALAGVTFSASKSIARHKTNPFRYAALAHKELPILR